MKLIGWGLTLTFTFLMVIDCIFWVFPVYTISENGSSSMYFIKLTDTNDNIQAKIGMWGLCALLDSSSSSQTSAKIDTMTSKSSSSKSSTHKASRRTLEPNHENFLPSAIFVAKRSLQTPPPTALPHLSKRDSGRWLCTKAKLGLTFTDGDLTNADIPILSTIQTAFSSTTVGVRSGLVLNVISLCLCILYVIVRAVIYLFQGQRSDEDVRTALEIRRRIQAIGVLIVLGPAFFTSMLAWIFNVAVFGSAKAKLEKDFQTEINVIPIILSVIANFIVLASLIYEYMVLKACNADLERMKREDQELEKSYQEEDDIDTDSVVSTDNGTYDNVKPFEGKPMSDESSTARSSDRRYPDRSWNSGYGSEYGKGNGLVDGRSVPSVRRENLRGRPIDRNQRTGQERRIAPGSNGRPERIAGNMNPRPNGRPGTGMDRKMDRKMIMQGRGTVPIDNRYIEGRPARPINRY